MCGICGIVSANPVPALKEEIIKLRDSMRHRGPDDHGFYLSLDRRVALANCRLSIIDLSAAGRQPMCNENGSLWIVYNGEVYNFKQLRELLEAKGHIFRSNTDTEVILHLWEEYGPKAVEHLRGMFAFAVWDSNNEKLYLVRDRLGIKPLYYAHIGSYFLFSSELKGLMSSDLISKSINPQALIAYLMFGSIPCALTIYENVHVLPPGSILILQNGKYEIQRYWRLPVNERVDPVPTPIVTEELRSLLQEAVSIRLISDVPLGAFLSGGLDSSVVVALMRQVSDGVIRTCSMTFEEEKFNEAPYSQIVANTFQTDHHERVITAQDVLNEWERIIWAMDQPTIDGVNTYFVSKTAREAGLTVALSGLGGDELFGGYPNTFQGVPSLLRWLKASQFVPVRGFLAKAIPLVFPNGRWNKVAEALGWSPTRTTAYFVRRGLFAPGEVRFLVHPEIWERGQFHPVEFLEEAISQGQDDDIFNWVSRAELSIYTLNQLLRDTDVMSMWHSLEVRVPLLDHRLVEFVLRLPGSVKTAGRYPKPLMMEAVGELLPEEIRYRRDKMGFSFPFEEWLTGPLDVLIKEAIDSPFHTLDAFLNPKAMQEIYRKFQKGHEHWSRIWALVVLSWWIGREGSK
ncbi:asparagine synthase (glutamine-hydrolyzing) [Candidatus Bipolaricaulota sp. J31]